MENHATSVMGMAFTDTVGIGAAPETSLVGQVSKKSDAITPPKLNVHFAAMISQIHKSKSARV
jgi:hypothetical protein